MKCISTLMSILLCSLYMQAQITLERVDFTLEKEVAVKGWILDTTGISPPVMGAGMTWDFSSQTVLNASNYTKFEADNLNFPDANLVDFTSQSALNGLVNVPTNFYEILNDDDYYTTGRTTAKTSLPSGPLTGGTNDTITFLETVNIYQEPVYFLRFPLNYADTWSYTLSNSTEFEITVAAFGLDHAPASNDISSVSSDTVLGYGTLILPHPDGTGTVSMEALCIKGELNQQSDYYLFNQPAPQAMLDVLGLTQGATTTIIDYAFYVKGLPRSALNMSFQSDGSIRYISISDDIRSLISSTDNPAASQIETKIFPNPSNGDFKLQFVKSDRQSWTLVVFNTLGQRIHSQIIDGNASEVNAEVQLATVSSGLHHFVLHNAEGAIVSTGNFVVH